MLGLVAVMGLARGSATAGTPGTVPASPSQVVVVVHHISSPTFPGVGKSPTPGTGTPSPPIALTARPTVQARRLVIGQLRSCGPMAVDERRFRVMASEAHVIIVGGPGGAVTSMLLDDARCYLEHLEQRWSRFLPASDITRINNSNGEPVEVDVDTITLFTTMARGLAGSHAVASTRPCSRAGRRGLPSQHRGPAPRHDPAVELPAPRRHGRHRHRTRPPHRSRSPRMSPSTPAASARDWPPTCRRQTARRRRRAARSSTIGGDLAMGGTPPDARRVARHRRARRRRPTATCAPSR